jgi:hypothetical protein
MKPWIERALVLSIVVITALCCAFAFGLMERVALRKVMKACHQQQQFSVGAQSFRCEPTLRQ